MKKKILALIIVLAFSITIVGCNEKKNYNSAANKENSSKVEDNVVDDKEESEKEENTETQKEIKPEDKEEEKPVEKPETKPNTSTPKPETKPETKPEIKPEEKPEEKPSINLSAEEVINKITAGVEGPNQISMEGDFFADQYGIDTGILENYKVIAPMMIVHANECAVFKVNDSKDIDKVKAGISKRLKYLDDVWKQYLAQQYELVKNNKIVVKGNYVLFVIDESADTIVSNFNNLFK